MQREGERTSDTARGARELVRRALDGRGAARPVAGPLAVHWCARAAGISLRDYTLRADRLAESVIRYAERLRPDAVWVSADTWVSAQAMGASVEFPGEDQPLAGAGRPLVRSAADLARIPKPDPASQGRWPLMLDAVRRVREGVGPDVFVVACFDQYPFSLACALMGLQNAMLAPADDRALIEAVMDRAAEHAVAYAAALAGAGADLLSGGDSPAGLLGPELYREIALPFERRVIAAVKARTGLPVSLHICGNAGPLLADMEDSGADVLELDQRTDLAEACRVVPGHVALWGNLDPVALLARGSPGDVAQAVRGLVRTTSEAGRGRFVVSSGCTLALETPEANVRALIETVKSLPAEQPPCAAADRRRPA